MTQNSHKLRCVIHGSFRRHFDEIQRVHQIFTQAGIDVVAPNKLSITDYRDNFALLEGEEELDPRLIELLYLHELKNLGHGGFSYFVNPGGYLGRSASYELGIAQVTNVPCFFMAPIKDHPAYLHRNSIWQPIDLADYIQLNADLPKPKIKRNESTIHNLWQELMVPGSVVATGAIIEYAPARRTPDEKEILLVKTHKWGGRYSVIGGRVRRNERLVDALAREVKEETGLNVDIGRHLCTFDQIQNSGYYRPGMQHIFVDNVVEVKSKKVVLNDEAQDYVWVRARDALRDLQIEPNAKHILELYVGASRGIG